MPEATQQNQYSMPPLGFYFKVKIGNDDFDFQSVSGLTKEIVTESFREGGQQYDYALPTKVQYAELVLKRGLWVPQSDPANSELEHWQKWFSEQTFQLRVQPQDLTIDLMRPTGTPYMTWNVLRAWPKKWVIADFNAEENQVVIETLELHYDYFEVVSKPPSPPPPSPIPST